MELINTIQAMQNLGADVVKQGRAILKRKKKTTNKNTLYNDFGYNVTSNGKEVDIEWFFGDAEDYWEFIDEGVVGVGGFKGKGKARGHGSSFRFKYANPGGKLITALKKWTKNKSISDKFIWGIGYNIKRKGLERTQFFSTPYKKLGSSRADDIAKAFADDIEIELKNKLK